MVRVGSLTSGFDHDLHYLISDRVTYRDSDWREPPRRGPFTGADSRVRRPALNTNGRSATDMVSLFVVNEFSPHRTVRM